MSAPYFLGIDGGGSATRARLTDAGGRVLGQGMAGPATLRLGGVAAWAALMAAGDAALQQAGLRSAHSKVYAGIGIAGISRRAAYDELESIRQTRSPFADAVIAGDAHMACLGAHGGADGGIVIVGTGSNAYGRVGARDVQIGGHGFPISDAGSGAAMGLATVRATLRAHDGLEAETGLTARIMQVLGGNAEGAVAWMERATATDYAALAPHVVSCLAVGDPLALRLLRNAAEDIGEMANALFSRGIPRVALVGGLAPVIAQHISPVIADRLTAAQGDAIDGALLAARRLAEQHV